MEAGMVRLDRSLDSLLIGAESGVLKPRLTEGPGEGLGLMASAEARGSISSSGIVMDVDILEVSRICTFSFHTNALFI